MFFSVVGHAECIDTIAATKEVIRQCEQQLDGQMPSAGIVFTSNRPLQDLMLKEILTHFPNMPLTGCTTGGEISAISGFKQDSICLILFISDTIQISSGASPNITANPEAATLKALNVALASHHHNPNLCIVFANNLMSCPVLILETLKSHLDDDCLIIGGYAASDIFPEGSVHQYCNQIVYDDGISLMLFSGPIETAFCLSNSWKPVGSKAVIEKSEDNQVSRISGKTALQFYHDMFGPHPEPLLEMPLAIYESEKHFYIRVANQFDLNCERVTFNGFIPEGSIVQFTEATPERVLTDTRDCVSVLTSSLKFTPQAGLVISCAARRNILGMQTYREADLIQKHLPDNIPFIGFYSYGEISPPAEGHSSLYHNCTMVTLLIGEKNNTTAAKPIPDFSKPIDSIQDKDELIKLLNQKLTRAERNLSQLEYNKKLSSRMLKKINNELLTAKRKIEEQHHILKESLTLAQQVQQRLLPHKPPEFPGFDISGRSIYCDQTGGDYFDYLLLPEEDGRLSVVVGDVSGHGIASALLMATARALLRMRVSKLGSPVDIISDMNRLLSKDLQGSGQFMSLYYLVLDTNNQTITWVRAGHDPALRYIPSEEKFDSMLGEGLVLGVVDDWHYNQNQSELTDTGEIILIGTDGIWETRDMDGRFL